MLVCMYRLPAVLCDFLSQSVSMAVDKMLAQESDEHAHLQPVRDKCRDCICSSITRGLVRLPSSRNAPRINGETQQIRKSRIDSDFLRTGPASELKVAWSFGAHSFSSYNVQYALPIQLC